MRNAWIWIVIVVLAIGGGLLWWQGSQSGVVSQETPTVNDTSDYTPQAVIPTDSLSTSTATNTLPVATTTVSVAPVKEIAVASKGFAFTPSTITVKKGDQVKITYTNGGGTHNFQIDGYNVGTKVIQGGQSDSVSFTADKAGTFEYFCSVGNHRAMGMKGKLVVTP